MTVSIQMAGNLWKVHVKAGDQIEKGQEVAILESMKMEIPIVADRSGNEGDFVNEGDVLLELSNSTQ